MNHTGENKRKYERFDLNFPATIKLADIDRKLHLFTRNISAGGAFFHTSQLLEKGMKITIEIVLENETLKKLTGCQSYIKVVGTVVRCEPKGVAVIFRGQEKIVPLQSMKDH
jgi:hypothetical protein